MKKTLLIRLLVVMAVFLASVGARAQDFKDGNIFYFLSNVDNEIVATVCINVDKYNKGEGTYSGNLVIPETAKYEGKTYPVIRIAGNAFKYCTELLSLSLPKTMKLDYFDFKDCKSLTKIEIDSENPYICTENYVIYNKDKTCIYAALPAMIKGHFTVPEGVARINNFQNCTGLTSITLPASLSDYESVSFYGCDNLTSITVAAGNKSFSSIKGLLSDKRETKLIAAPQGLTGKLLIPSEFTSINKKAFYGCNKLKSVTIPSSINSLHYLEGPVFYQCDSLVAINIGLLTIDIPYNIADMCPNFQLIDVDKNNNRYFPNKGILCDKRNLSHNLYTLVIVPQGIKGELKIPEDIGKIGKFAFYNCAKITTLELQEPLSELHYDFSYGTSYAFGNMPSLKKLIIRSKKLYNDSYKNFEQISSNVTVYAPNAIIRDIKEYFKGTVLPIDMPYTITDIKTYIKGVSFKLTKTEGVEPPAEPLKVVIDGKEITPDANGTYFCTGLKEKTTYNIEISGCEPCSFKTEPLNVNLSFSSTQTTISVNSLNISTDETFKFSKCGFTFNGKDYDFNGKGIKFSGLKTCTDYDFTPYVYQNGEKITFPVKTKSTNGVYLRLTCSDLAPTSASLKGTIDDNDTKVSKIYFYHKGTEIEGTSLSYTGLDPDTQYTFYFRIECEDGYHTSTSVTVTTKALELTTLQPKGVSSSCSIVAATTNMSSEETGAGFQWRKYDAPSTLKSSEGFAAIYAGQLEGYLKNLQSTSYYNVRAFYKSSTGKYYYGDWVTFDPSDFSFFEPTVHTYATTDISHNKAKVRGYVLAGTDDINSQGFEYWSASNQKRVKAFAPVNNDNIQTVLSNGQVMTATLSDLEPETEYFYRAFVTTSAGTKYGEEQSFTTPNDPSGVETVVVDNARTVVGYYDVNGRRYTEAQRGFNIVVYSDGTTEKVVVK